MKLTIHIAEHKTAFFLELLKSFEDFISVEETADTPPISLSAKHKAILDKRLASLEQQPDKLLRWETVQQQIEQNL